MHYGNGRVILSGECARDFESRDRQLVEVDWTQDSLKHVLRPKSRLEAIGVRRTGISTGRASFDAQAGGKSPFSIFVKSPPGEPTDARPISAGVSNALGILHYCTSER